MLTEDLHTIKKEFSSYFSKLELIDDCLYCVSAEGNHYIVRVTNDGWFAVNEANQEESDRFPIFETLMKRLSPAFDATWQNELFSRLAELQSESE